MNISKEFKKLGVKHPVVYGCMGLGGGWNQNPISKCDIKQAHEVIDTALINNMSLFDHADIYTFGKAERAFGQVLRERPELRDQIVIQSKCGIRFEDSGLAGVSVPKRYDFSKAWITQSVDGILDRLQIEHLPVLLLHRPDPLMDIEEVATTLNDLQKSGKIGYIGVSNMSAQQMALLQSQLNSPIVANQLELSLSKRDWLEQGIMNNVGSSPSYSIQAGTIEYCQMNNVQIQSWGSLSQGIYTRALDSRSIKNSSIKSNDSEIHQAKTVINRISNEKAVSNEAVLLAWLMKHPSQIMPVIGTTNIDRINACAQAIEVTLTREQWYEIYVAARGEELP